ncbi:hypothetical protein PIB30_013200 [Stylosanthes scabra]|uniref:RNase H type-1 domain-containing protein n=1 Tax=Stylosanthes scabra TaxID=79078 RepID=A0ABU6Z5E4_9FABA|nr:hypothetical protein [Stylosanthes scabra]
MFMVGGYLCFENGRVVCLMGDIADEKTEKESNIRGAADAIQFLIEEVEVREEEVMMILDNKDLVDWIQGKESTDWNLTFLRNRARNMKQLFDIMELKFKANRTFKAREYWLQIANNNNERWIL